MSLTYGDLRTNVERVVDESLKNQVLRGIKWLEENVGPDWVDKIDPRSLYLSKATSCILGQVFKEEGEECGESGYDWALGEFGFNDTSLGFNTDNEFGDLTNAWLVALGYEPRQRDPELWGSNEDYGRSILAER